MVDDIETTRPKGLLILFTSFKMLDILPDAEFRHVVNAMRRYVEIGSEPEGLEPIEQVAFESQREAMNGSIETYQRSILANRQNGRKGGRPRKAVETDGITEEPTETHGFSEKPTETEKTHNKNKNNNNSDTNVSESIGANAPPPTKSKKFSPPDVETVKNYFAEKGGTEGQAIQFFSYYESIGWKRGKNPMQKWRAAATGWISRDREQHQTKPAQGSQPKTAAQAYADIFKGVK